MAIHQLLFGSYDWPERDERPKKYPVGMPPRIEKLTVRLPRGLKEHVEEAAERDGISAEAWAAEVLARNVPDAGSDR